MAKTTGFGQLELLEIEERDSILFGLYARGGVFKKAIDEDVAEDLINNLSEVDDEMAYANSGRGPWGIGSMVRRSVSCSAINSALS